MFKTIAEFEKSFPGVKNLTPEQKQKSFDIFNAMKRENPKMDDGMAIATAMKTAKGMMSDQQKCQGCDKPMEMKDGVMTCLTCGKTKKLEEVNNVFHYLSMIGEPGDKTSTLEVLRVGVIRDRDLRITKKMLEEYVQNYKDNVYGTEVQVNLEHKRGSEAAGWVKDLYIEGDKLMAKVEWTELGMEKISKKLFKFVSAELANKYPHFKSGDLIGNVFIGLALTNTPALKGQDALALSEQIEELINKDNIMFKKYLQSLKERKIVSKEEKITMHVLLADLPEDEKTTVAGEVGEVDAKPEVAEKTEEEKKAEAGAKATEAAKTAGGENLAEKLVEVNKNNLALQEKVKKMELKEEMQKSYLLSTTNKIGFQEVDLDIALDFVATLSEEQMIAFKQVFSKIRSVDLSTIGQSGKTEEQLSEEAKLVKADVKARALAEKTQRPLADCLSEVYVEMGIVK